jgi:hypothetical protein
VRPKASKQHVNPEAEARLRIGVGQVGRERDQGRVLIGGQTREPRAEALRLIALNT